MPPKTHLVKPGPDRRAEQPVRYYQYMAEICYKHFGRRPSRTTLFKYLATDFPVAKGGPYVKVPVYYALKRPMTTIEACSRFVTLVRRLESIHGITGINGPQRKPRTPRPRKLKKKKAQPPKRS